MDRIDGKCQTCKKHPLCPARMELEESMLKRPEFTLWVSVDRCNRHDEDPTKKKVDGLSALFG